MYNLFVIVYSGKSFLSDSLQPIGALNPKRAAFYAEHYETWDDDSTPPDHYTTLYSTAHSTLMWMLRIVITYFTHLMKPSTTTAKTSCETGLSFPFPAGALHHIFPQRKRWQVRPCRQILLWYRTLVEELPEGHG